MSTLSKSKPQPRARAKNWWAPTVRRVLCEKANWKYGKQNRAIFEQARPQQKQALVDTRHEAQQRA
jgi:hypothetical protein